MKEHLKQKKVLVPFWERKREEENTWWKNKYVRKTSLYIKWILYFFSGVMIIWSFIQSLAAPYTNYQPNPGTGLEFGYNPYLEGESTGNVRFDLGSWSIAGPKYHAFYEPSTVYGPFLSWFVYPIARIFVGLVYSFNKNEAFPENTALEGLDVIFAMIIVMSVMRFINFWPTLRSSIYMERQLSHQPAIDAINNKYNKFDPTDKKAKLQRHQELSSYNKKHNLKPFVVLENFFISTPIFLIIFRVITISRPIKFTKLLGLWDLSKTPINMIVSHLTEDGWKYLILCLIIMPVNFFSQRVNTVLSRIRNPKLRKKEEARNSRTYQMMKVQKIMTFLFLIFTFFWSTSLAIYYFFNSIFTIFQHLLIHQILIRRKKKVNMAQVKLQKLGINV